MKTLSSLIAQNQFGALLDLAQREPVTITRRQRPIAVLMSMEDYQKRDLYLSATVAKAISEQFPARGEDAALILKKLYTALKESHANELSETQLDDLINPHSST